MYFVITLARINYYYYGGARPKSIDPFGYHFVGCKTAANAIRLHDEVVAVVAWLFRSLRLDVIVEPTSLFGHNLGDVSNRQIRELWGRSFKSPFCVHLDRNDQSGITNNEMWLFGQ